MAQKYLIEFPVRVRVRVNAQTIPNIGTALVPPVTHYPNRSLNV